MYENIIYESVEEGSTCFKSLIYLFLQYQCIPNYQALFFQYISISKISRKAKNKSYIVY